MLKNRAEYVIARSPERERYLAIAYLESDAPQTNARAGSGRVQVPARICQGWFMRRFISYSTSNKPKNELFVISKWGG